MRISIIGSKGQVGSELATAGLERGWDIQALDHADVEVTNLDNLKSALGSFHPDYVINTAAFHNVGECEKFPDIANEVNSLGAKYVADVAADIGAVAVYISTDYVFDGALKFGKSYLPEDATNPLNAYGASKLAGERVTLGTSPNNIVLRISSVFGIRGNKSKGGNFVDKILARVSSGEDVTVPADNAMSPTYAVDVAAKALSLIGSGSHGIWHANNNGSVSWFGFAQAISSISKSSGRVLESQVAQDETILRPRNSSLEASNILGSSEDQFWYPALVRYLREKGVA